MSIATFKNALQALDDESVSIGGGEPTIHPQFWEMIGLALGSCESVWLATNGKATDTALALANLAKRGVLGCDLSTDAYHEPVEPAVYEVFKRDSRPGEYIGNRQTDDMRGERDVTFQGTKEPIMAGRCDWGNEGDCVCSEFIVEPNGDVRGCGCFDAPCFGNVNNTVEFPDDWEWGECTHDQT